MNRRTFTTIAKGKSYGYIKSIFTKGFFVNANYIQVNSSRYMDTEYDVVFNTLLLDNESKQKLNKYLINKKPVFVYGKQELFTHPKNGKMLGEIFALKITEEAEEQQQTIKQQTTKEEKMTEEDADLRQD